MEEKVYFCVGCTESFGYRPGMVNWGFISTEDKEKAVDYAIELACKVVEAYSHALLDMYDEDEDEDTILSDEQCAECYLVTIDRDIDELSNMVEAYGLEDFITSFCESV